MISLIIIAFVAYLDVTAGDFIYPDFNQTLGLTFNGDATTSDCGLNNTYITTRLDGIKLANINGSNTREQSVFQISQEDGLQTRMDVVTNDGSSETSNIGKLYAQFGHRNISQPSIRDGCRTRLRLTPSAPSKVGSVWYENRVPVVKGFDTIFTFQISGHSRVCSEYIEPISNLKHHRSCAVHGGDGFAFVIQNDDKNETHAIGGDGANLGYGGISNSLAIEFDMWTNANTKDGDDLFQDHISVHSASTQPNSPGSSTALGFSRVVDLADGKVHTARVKYLPYLDVKYFDFMTANTNLIPHLKDNGEGRRLGTLVIFLDEGIEADKPILALPLNLSVILNLPQSLAFVGFTSSTGLKWEKHDIINWRWCNSNNCE